MVLYTPGGFMPITALHLDQDGTLVNTEELKQEAHRDTVKHLGGRGFISRERYCELMGTSNQSVVKIILAECRVDGTYSDYRSVYETCYHNLVDRRAEAHRGVLEFLRLARSAGIKLAVVSSSSRLEMERVLTKTKIRPLIDGFVSADDVERSKPDPEPYLKALPITFGNRDNGIALEDTDTGVQSALAAGLSVIAIRHELNAGHAFKGARRILHVYEMADAKRFLSLVTSL